MAKHKSFASLVVMLSLCAGAFGCASGSPMERVSARVMHSVDAGYSLVMEGPFWLRTRKNVCECDSQLVYEAEIFGVFRHIKVDREIPGLEAEPREVCLGQTGALYEAAHGQMFYAFEVLSDDSCIR